MRDQEDWGEINMAYSLEDLNKLLDKLLLDFFDKFDKLQNARNALANEMKNGFYLMSKARYTMGNKSVTSLQYGDKMEATTKVFVENSLVTQPEEGVEKENTDEQTHLFELCFNIDGAEEDKCKSSCVYSASESSVRKRVNLSVISKDNLTNSKEVKEEEKRASEKSLKKRNDPLKWFGVLVPPSLRQCQHEFKTSCQLLCDIASLEREISRIMSTYKQLKEQKHACMS